jgi:hypothetical protein
MPTGIPLSGSVLVGTQKPVDAKFGPYGTTAEALADISSGYRYVGLTIGIRPAGGAVAEYWFKNGILDTDFVLKSDFDANGNLRTPAVQTESGSTVLGTADRVLVNADAETVAQFSGNFDLRKPLEFGGTNGATNAATSRTNLGAAAANHSHAIIDVSGLQTALDGKADSSHTHTEFQALTVYEKLIVAPSTEPSPAEQQAYLWAPYAAFNELDINGTTIYPDDQGTVISGTPVTISCPLAFSNPSAVRAAIGAASETATQTALDGKGPKLDYYTQTILTGLGFTIPSAPSTHRFYDFNIEDVNGPTIDVQVPAPTSQNSGDQLKIALSTSLSHPAARLRIVRVTSVLNQFGIPSTATTVIATLAFGESLTLLCQSGEWVVMPVDQHGHQIFKGPGNNPGDVGRAGFVPAPVDGDQSKYLRGDGVWTAIGAQTLAAHKSTHATGGSDALTPADIGAAPADPTDPSTAAAAASLWDIPNGESAFSIVDGEARLYGRTGYDGLPADQAEADLHLDRQARFREAIAAAGSVEVFEDRKKLSRGRGPLAEIVELSGSSAGIYAGIYEFTGETSSPDASGFEYPEYAHKDGHYIWVNLGAQGETGEEIVRWRLRNAAGETIFWLNTLIPDITIPIPNGSWRSQATGQQVFGLVFSRKPLLYRGEIAVPHRFTAVSSNWLTTDTIRYFNNFADLSWRDNINAAHWLVTKPSTIKRVLYYFSSGGSTVATAHTGATLNLYPKAGGSAIPLISGINLVGLAVSGVVHTFDSGPLDIEIAAAAFAVGIQTGTTTSVPTACRHTIEIFTT